MVITGIREYFTLIGKKCPILLLFLWLHCKNKKICRTLKKTGTFLHFNCYCLSILKCLGVV